MFFAAGRICFAAGAIYLGGLSCARAFEQLDDQTSLLQHSASATRARWPRVETRCAPIRKTVVNHYVVKEDCGGMITQDPVPPNYPGSQLERDLDRPLSVVASEHPGENLYYYFGNLNMWINKGAAVLPCSSYEGCRAAFLSSASSGALALGHLAPEMTFEVDGRNITTRKDHICQTGDDPYCYSLGWMKGQNIDISLVADPAAWQQQGASQCQMFKERFDFTDEEITLGGHINETSMMYVKSDNVCSLLKGQTGPRATTRDYVKHAYAKCFMNNVSTEMAYCYFRGCVLPSGKIGHREECGY